jgi:hypothetical protein
MDGLNMSSYVAAFGLKGLLLFSSLVIALGLVVNTTITWYLLRHIPGPFFASISYFWMCRNVLTLRLDHIIGQLREKYGKIIRISPTDVLLSDPESLWHISSARSLYPRGAWYSSIRFNPYGESVFSELDIAKHDKRKAKLINGFSGKRLMELEVNVDAQLAVLLDVLKDKVSQGQGQAVIDIGVLLQYFQVDLITLAVTGEAWGNMAANKDHFGYLAQLDTSIPFLHAIATVPLLSSIFFSAPFLKAFGPNMDEGWLGFVT